MAQPTQVRVGGYRILRKLAVGGMAEIFLAQLEARHGFTKKVVIKRMLPQLCEDPSFVEMFMHEARLAAHLNHPNVAQVFDIGESEGRPHYAMEYVHGADLRAIGKRMHASGSGPRLDLVLGIGIGAAAGLHHAHTARDEHGRPLDVVHRDVTPSNVVMTYSGVPKLLDFGVAKASLDGRESTAVGVLKGKLPYMSPEQIDTSVRLDARSDVFSLGVVLWELTTLRRLFRYPSQVEVIRRITGEDAPPPSSVIEDYPPKLEAIVMRALARDRDARWPDAHALQRELELFAAERGVVVSATRIAEHMDELFALELAAERDRDDDAPTRVRSGAPGASASLPGLDAEHGGGSSSLPTVLESEGEGLVSPPVELERGSGPGLQPEPEYEPEYEPRSSRRSRAAWMVAAGVAVVALVALAFGLGRQASEDAADPLPSASTPVVEAPADELPEPSPEPEPTVVEDPDPITSGAEVPPVEPSPKAARPRKKSSKKRGKASASASDKGSDWNKNSLSMPD